jgi:hypothetical protein
VHVLHLDHINEFFSDPKLGHFKILFLVIYVLHVLLFTTIYVLMI